MQRRKGKVARKCGERVWGGGGERESIVDDEPSGRPKGATTDENVFCTVWPCMKGGRNLHVTASEVGIIFGAVQSILTDILGLSKVSAR